MCLYDIKDGSGDSSSPSSSLEALSWHHKNKNKNRGRSKGRISAAFALSSRTRSFPAAMSDMAGVEDSVWECGICFENPVDPCVTTCGHLFCWKDLRRWLEKNISNPQCPICKTRCVPMKDVVTIFVGPGLRSSAAFPILQSNKPSFIDTSSSSSSSLSPMTPRDVFAPIIPFPVEIDSSDDSDCESEDTIMMRPSPLRNRNRSHYYNRPYNNPTSPLDDDDDGDASSSIISSSPLSPLPKPQHFVLPLAQAKKPFPSALMELISQNEEVSRTAGRAFSMVALILFVSVVLT